MSNVNELGQLVEVDSTISIDEPQELTFQEVWQKLSGVDLKPHLRSKGKFDYLPWAAAWQILMDYYPQASYKFAKPVYYDDRTCEVWCTVKIDKLKRTMWLPVLNHNNQPVIEPTSHQINTARMRALVKTIAMFGLGSYVYMGEDLPPITPDKKKTMSGEEVDEDKVQKAYQWIVKIIRETDEDYEAAPKVQEAWTKLSHDEQMAVNNLLRDVKEGRKQYNTILKELLTWTPPEQDADRLPENVEL